MSLGDALRFFRVRREMTQADLAEASGISISYISLVERDKRDASMKTVMRFANALQVPLVLIVFVAEDGFKSEVYTDDLKGKMSVEILRCSKLGEEV
jgi:transcriptional regulator with XRE-family HTH domain